MQTNDILKLSLAAAALMAAGGPAYYYTIYLPSRDAIRQASDDQVRQEQRTEREARRMRYDSCIESATTDYTNNWTLSCQDRSKANGAAFKRCKAAGYLSEAECRELNPAIPAKDCTLPGVIADGLNEDLSKAKSLCVAEAKANIPG